MSRQLLFHLVLQPHVKYAQVIEILSESRLRGYYSVQQFLKRLLLFYVYDCFACMYVCVTCMCLVSKKARIEYLGPQEQPFLLTVEPSL